MLKRASEYISFNFWLR